MVDGVELYADVHRPEGVGPWPVVVMLHGGALIMGSRRLEPSPFIEQLLAGGVAVVSPDYRLAPETKLSEIWTDVVDLFAWIRASGATLFNAMPDRLGVHGTSAGGYLALLCGCRIQPAPRVVGAFAGYGDITGTWYTEPSAWYRTQPLVAEADAMATVGHGCPTDDQTGHNRRSYYLFLRQTGRWPREVGGMDLDRLRAFCPLHHVTPEFPPAVLYHGTADHDVPFAESEAFAAALMRQGVEHLFLPLADVDHVNSGARPEEWDEVVRRTAAFMLSRLLSD